MLLQIQDGTLSIGGQTVLSHFHFEIRGNEKIAVIGRNGCGKTTLLRLLAGNWHLTGTIKVFPRKSILPEKQPPVFCPSRHFPICPSRWKKNF